MHDGGGGDGSVSTIQQESNKNSNGSVRVGYSERVLPSVETGSLNGENGNMDVKGNSGLGPSKNLEGHEINNSASGKHSCVIDVMGGGGENCDGERICRICHLSYQEDPDAPKTELILLGCGCKDDLGSAHVHCAEAWFKLKGNRLCEICGEAAKNVMGVADNRFIEGWSDTGDSSGRTSRCLHGQPFCNFLLSCLVIAFVLPWFLRVSMF